MNIDLLQALGLTVSQAETYLALVKAGHLTPPQLARKTGEGRTAAYMSLAKLEELGLATKDPKARTLTYLPASPTELRTMLEQRRKELAEMEDGYRRGLSEMLSYFYAHRREPSVQFYAGEEGLRAIYLDHLETGEDVFFIRTTADEEYFGSVLYDYMTARAMRGITGIGLAPDFKSARQWAAENDKAYRREMSWYPPQAYTAPVEIAIYGQKVSFISFGEEAMGTIIDSPQIAEAMRQVFAMARVGADSLRRRQRK